MKELYSSVIIAVAVFIFFICVSAPAVKKRVECVSRLESAAGAVPIIKDSVRPASRIVQLFQKIVSGKSNRSMKAVHIPAYAAKAISAAGHISPGFFTFLRMLSGSVSGTAVFITAHAFTSLLLSLSAGLAAFALGTFIPIAVAHKAADRRRRVLLDSMAPAMDLLAICTSSGLGFDAAVVRISAHDSSPCIEELKTVVSDVQHGMSRSDAYSNMDSRCSLKEMTSFINALSQSEELGVPLDRVLEEQACLLRDMRRLRAEEAAVKAPVKMTIPLVLFIFPSIFIVLLGPAVIKLLEVIG